MAERGIYNEVTDELRGASCPAADLIGSLRGQRMANTPGVRCRVTHESLSMDSDQMTLRRWCCATYTECPVWRFEKDRLWANKHTFGDERELARADERQWREDLTGSEYGDTSFMTPIDEAVRENEESMLETGMVEARTGAHLEIEP